MNQLPFELGDEVAFKTRPTHMLGVVRYFSGDKQTVFVKTINGFRGFAVGLLVKLEEEEKDDNDLQVQ